MLTRAGTWSRSTTLTVTRPNAPPTSRRARGYAWAVRQEVAAVSSRGAPVSGRLRLTAARDVVAKTSAKDLGPWIAWRIDKRGRLRLQAPKPPPRAPGAKPPPPDAILDRCLATLRALPAEAAIDALLPPTPQRIGATWKPDPTLVAAAAGLDPTVVDPRQGSATARLKAVAGGRATIRFEATYPLQLADGRSGQARVALTHVRALSSARSGALFRRRTLTLTLALEGDLPTGRRVEATTLKVDETVSR